MSLHLRRRSQRSRPQLKRKASGGGPIGSGPKRDCRPLRVESLERRDLLAAVIAQPPISSEGLRDLVDQGTAFLPSEAREILSPILDLAQDFNASMSFVAFPGETNDVRIGAQAGNVILQLDESSDNLLLRLNAPGAMIPFSKDLINNAVQLNLGFKGGGQGTAGPVVAEIGALLGGMVSFEDLPTSILKNFVDFPDSRALVVNPTALVEMLPAFSDVVGVFNDVLDFNITSLIDPITEPGIIFPGLPSKRIKFGPFKIGAGKIIPEFTLIPPSNVTEILGDAGVPTSIRDVFDFLPSEVRGIISQIETFVDMFDTARNRFISDSIFVATLDGNDRIDTRLVTGMDQRLYAGAGHDTIIPGGSESVFAYLERQGLPIGFLPPVGIDEHSELRVFAGDGDDTIVIDRRFNRFNFHVDGGAGNDRLLIPGDDKDDIIKIVAGDDGMLKAIRFYVPDPNAGEAANEVQQLALPAGTTGGTFRLTFLHRNGGNPMALTTEAIPFEPAPGETVTAGDIAAALETLPPLQGNVAVSGPIGGPWVIEFSGGLARSAQAPLTVDTGELITAAAEIRTVRVAEGSRQEGRNEIQRVMLPVTAEGARYLTGGEFVLTFDGETTAPIGFNANSLAVQNALADLSTIGDGNVRVNGSAGGPWFVEFIGDLGLQDQPLLVPGGEDGLFGGIAGAVSLDQDASPATQVISLPSSPVGLGGTFSLSFDDGTIADATGSLPVDASAFELEEALGRLASVGFENVEVVGPAGGPWTVELFGRAAASANLIAGNANDLRGGVTGLVTSVDGFGRNEVQTVSLDNVDGGTFTLTFSDGTIERTTGPLLHDATPGEIRQALASLGSIGGVGNVSVGGPAGGPWQVEFLGELAVSQQDLITVDVSGLTPADPLDPVTSDVFRSTTHLPGANETQTLTFDPLPTGGNFRLLFDGEVTPPIPHSASATVVRATLESFVGIGPGNVQVTQTAGGFEFVFVGDLAHTDVETIQVDASNLAGGFIAPDIDVVDTAGVVNEIQTVTLTPQPEAGTFRLAFFGEQTEPIPHDADADAVRDALTALSSFGPGDLSVTRPSANEWQIEFGGQLAGFENPLLSVVASGLSLANPIDVLRDTEAAPTNELQTVALPNGAQSGDFTLRFGSVLVDEVQAGSGSADEVQRVTLPGGTTGGTFRLSFRGSRTAPLDHDASAAEIEAALRGLPSVAGDHIEVTAGPGANQWTVTFTGQLGQANQPLLRADAGGLEGDFTTGTLPLNATAGQVQAALQALPSIGPGNVSVTSDEPNGGPWQIEFIGDLAARPLERIVGQGVDLIAQGDAEAEVTVLTQGGDGNPVLRTTTEFSTLRNVEALVIEGGGGNDRLIVDGAPRFPLGIFFDGGDGTDVIEFISHADSPEFVSPIFPDDTQAIVTMDGQDIQFANVEGELIFDASERPGSVFYSGTDSADDMRFAGIGPGTATLANDGQVALRLRNFAHDSRITLLGEQGDDTLSIAPGGVAEFSTVTIRGGGPAGANRVRFEGTPGNDVWTYRPDPVDPHAGFVTYDFGGSTLSVPFEGAGLVDFVGLGGQDRFTALEPFEGSDDVIVYSQEAGNNASFRFISQQGVTSSPVRLSNIEQRIFDTGSGRDRLSVFRGATFPDLDLNVEILGGEGTTTIRIEDAVTTFLHDPSEPDLITLENDAHAAQIDVTPGVGLDIDLGTIFGATTLRYHARGVASTIDARNRRVSQPGYGDVTFTKAEEFVWIGDTNPERLTFLAGSLVEPLTYRPSGTSSGGFRSDDLNTDYRFNGLTGELLVEAGPADDDHLVVEGSAVDDRILVDAAGRTVGVRVGPLGIPYKPIRIGDSVARLTVDARQGRDVVWVAPDYAAGTPLVIDARGGSAAESNRLVVEDEGPGSLVQHFQRQGGDAGEVIVGSLPPVTYEAFGRVDILPIDDDPASDTFGGTGDDRLGRIVVFHPDPFSQNDSWRNPTELENLRQHIQLPHISPGGVVDPFGLGLDLPGDEDWYRYTATDTSTLRFGLWFEPIGTLPNGEPGLPGDGQLRVDAFRSDGTPIERLAGETDPAAQTIGVEQGESYLLRVRGLTPEAINLYDIRAIDLDDIGPVVFDPDGDGPQQAIQVSGYPEFNLFNVKPRDQGPTPPVRGLTIHIQDGPVRFPGFLYEALEQGIAEHKGHYHLVGDHNGIIAIAEVIVTNHPVQPGELATATIELRFDEPLPDDRFTLTISDALVDPGGNRLDGESNADEPSGEPEFPSGDGVAGGDFAARFTVDSRPEIGTVSQGVVYIDANGNFRWDPAGPHSDATNRDFVFQFGSITDAHFAGNFPDARTGIASGFDKLGVYGLFEGVYSFMLDTTDDGVGDFASVMPPEYQVNGIPVAGNFSPETEGDQIGLFDGEAWYIDMNGNGRIDVGERIPANYNGLPIVGDFNGDGTDDFAVYDNATNTFIFDYNRDGNADAVWEVRDDLGRFPGISGFTDRPVAGDFNLDGIDDIGLWTAGRQGVLPREAGEFFFWISDGPGDHPSEIFRPFSPAPIGNDLFAQFGDEKALPIFGNFDPPVTADDAETAVPRYLRNPDDPYDVNGDGKVTPLDALLIINALNRRGGEIVVPSHQAVRFAATLGHFYDTSGDNRVTALDALQVINRLSRQGTGGGAGEGERAPASAGASAEGGDAAFGGDLGSANYAAAVDRIHAVTDPDDRDPDSDDFWLWELEHRSRASLSGN